MDASARTEEWVSVAEASRRLKLSPSEVRRRIRVGILTGERQPRGPGDTRDRFVVQMPRLVSEHAFIPLSGSQDASGAYTRCAVGGCQAAPGAHAARTDNALSDAQPRADSERLAGVVDGMLQAKAQTEVWLIQEVGALRQRLGRTEAERDNALARTEELAAGVDQYRREYAWLKEQYEQERRRSWWRRLLGLT